jgi:hypothetical protein
MLDSGFQMAQSKIVYFISRQRLSTIPNSSTEEILSTLDSRDSDLVKAFADESSQDLPISHSVAYFAFIPPLEHVKRDGNKEIHNLEKRERLLNYIWPTFILLGILIQLIT